VISQKLAEPIEFVECKLDQERLMRRTTTAEAFRQRHNGIVVSLGFNDIMAAKSKNNYTTSETKRIAKLDVPSGQTERASRRGRTEPGPGRIRTINSLSFF
jgi:uncharacterized protein (DUF3084 family)